MGVKIPKIDEPANLKRKWKEEIQRNRKIAIAAIKQGTWFTKLFWNNFKDILKAQGVTWQDLMEAFGLCQYKFIRWIEDKESWSNVMLSLEDALNDVIKYKRERL